MPRILIVEPDSAQARTLAESFARAGFDVEICQDTEQAGQRFLEGGVDWVLADSPASSSELPPGTTADRLLQTLQSLTGSATPLHGLRAKITACSRP